MKKGEKSKMETTRNYQENKVQQQNQQELFDLETKRKIKDSLQEIYNKQQRQQQATNGSSKKHYDNKGKQAVTRENREKAISKIVISYII